MKKEREKCRATPVVSVGTSKLTASPATHISSIRYKFYRLYLHMHPHCLPSSLPPNPIIITVLPKPPFPLAGSCNRLRRVPPTFQSDCTEFSSAQRHPRTASGNCLSDPLICIAHRSGPGSDGRQTLTTDFKVDGSPTFQSQWKLEQSQELGEKAHLKGFECSWSRQGFLETQSTLTVSMLRGHQKTFTK